MIDVCLLLEGTYPYVAGGVSTWVHQLISSMKDIRFGIVYIASHSDPTRASKYDIPHHVVYLKEIYLHDYHLDHYANRRPRKKDYQILKQFYDDLENETYDQFPQLIQLFRGDTCCFDLQRFFSSKKIWNLLTDYYSRYARGYSFLDFFWTWRGIHLPLLEVLHSEIPEAKIYHSVSTGYAGLIGAMARVLYGRQFFLTEHGIYTHERLLEISQANWIFEQDQNRFRAEKDLSFFKQWWVSIFKVMSHLAYQYADRIFTLYEGNKVREILCGAKAEKISIIPNGIDVAHYSNIEIQKKEKPQIGFVGRVVNIKDVKTYIQAAKIVLYTIPDATFYIIGPKDEEQDYFEECQRLIESLGLEEKVIFTGRADTSQYYNFLDLVVLTSLSEAQPYVILEANIVGIPIVATAVGACYEMVNGSVAEDQALGPSGLVTEVANPQSTAEAIVRLLKDPVFYKRCSEAGKERVKRYYDQDDLLSRYLNIYEQNL